MPDDSEHQMSKRCYERFERIFELLQNIDGAIRGNGKPGIQMRLDRLEQSAKSRSKFGWLAIAGVFSAINIVVAVLINYAFSGGN